jgi:hypothetical protein
MKETNSLAFETVAFDLLAHVAGGADGGCGNFVELTAPNGSKSYYDPVGIISLAPPVQGESMKNARTAMKTQLGTFYAAEPVKDVKGKIAAACGVKDDQ